MLPGPTKAEARLLGYLSGMAAQPQDGPTVRAIAAACRNLSFRSLAFPSAILDQIANVVENVAAGQTVDSETQSRIGAAIALATTALAPKRPIEALVSHSRLLRRWDEGMQSASAANELQHSLAGLLGAETIGAAMALAVWGEWVSRVDTAVHSSERTDQWVTMSASLVEKLAKAKDFLGGFAVWAKAVDWSTRPSATDVAKRAVLEAAYPLIGLCPLEVNWVLWTYVLGASELRDRPEAKGVSVLSAIDMATFLATKREAEQEIVETAVAKYRDSNNGLSLTTEGLEGLLTSEIAGALVREFDAPVREILLTAATWVDDGMVFSTHWNEILNRRKVLHRRAHVCPSVLPFIEKVSETDSVGFQEMLVKVRSGLQVSEDPSAWVLTPPVPGKWQSLETRSQLSDVASFLALPGQPLAEGTLVVEHARVRDLSIYKDAKLAEVQVVHGSGRRGAIAFVCLKNAVVVLTGESGQVHQLNRAGYLAPLNDAEMATDYIVFFTSFIRGDAGPFQIVGDVSDIPFASPPSAELTQRIASQLVPAPLAYRDESDAWRMKATMLYGSALFSTTLQLAPSGAIEMLNDDPWESGLDVIGTKMDGPMRILVD